MQTNFEDIIDQAKKEGINRFSTGILLVKNKRILVLLRKEDDFLPNIYELPGGKVENNESLLEGIKRELLEETGLNLDKVIAYLGYFEYSSEDKQKTRQFNFVVSVKRYNEIVHPEHQGYRWIKLTDLDNIPITEEMNGIIIKYFEKFI